MHTILYWHHFSGTQTRRGENEWQWMRFITTVQKTEQNIYNANHCEPIIGQYVSLSIKSAKWGGEVKCDLCGKTQVLRSASPLKHEIENADLRRWTTNDCFSAYKCSQIDEQESTVVSHQDVANSATALQIRIRQILGRWTWRIRRIRTLWRPCWQ